MRWRKLNRKNNLSLAKEDERFFNSANSLQGLIGKHRETSEDEQLWVRRDGCESNVICFNLSDGSHSQCNWWRAESQSEKNYIWKKRKNPNRRTFVLLGFEESKQEGKSSVEGVCFFFWVLSHRTRGKKTYLKNYTVKEKKERPFVVYLNKRESLYYCIVFCFVLFSSLRNILFCVW